MSVVEIGTDDPYFQPTIKPLEILKKHFGDRFLIRKVNFDYLEINGKKYTISPNSVRFITTPTFKSEYVYISDVDIITLQKDMTDIHIKNMDKTKLNYSNIVRPLKNTDGEIKRLSGLHFTPYSNYYPIPDISNLCSNGFLSHDEGLLYKIVEKRYPNFNYDESYRPVHGIHVSLNREPNGKLGWGMDRWKNEWLEFRNKEIFNEIEKVLPSFLLEKIKIIDNHYK